MNHRDRRAVRRWGGAVGFGCLLAVGCQGGGAPTLRSGFEVPDRGRVLDLTRPVDADADRATRLLAPALLDPTGDPVTGISAGRLIAPLVILDLREASLADPAANLGVRHIELDEAENGDIPAGAVVFLRTGLSASREGPGALGGFEPAAVEFLIQQRGAIAFGVETPALSAAGDGTDETTRRVLVAGRYGVVNLGGLDRVPLRGALAFVAPLYREGAAEAPARVLALVPRTVAQR